MAIKRELFPVLWMNFVNVLAFSIMIPVVPVFIRELHFPDYFLGIVMGSYFLSLFIGSPLMGRLAERFSKKRVLILSNVGTLIGWALMLLASFHSGFVSLALLVVSRVVDGLTGGNTSVLQAMAAEISGKHDRTKVFGIIGATFGIGFIIGPFAGGFLYSLFGLSGAALFSILLTAVSIAAISAFVEDSPLRLGTRHYSLFEAVKNAAKDLLLRFLSTFFFSAYTTIFPLLLIDRFSYGSKDIGLLFVAIGIMSTVNLSFVIHRIEKLLGEKLSMAVGAVLMGIGIIGVSFSHGIPLLLFFNYFFNLGGLMFSPIIKSRLSRMGPYGTMLGADESARALARALSPLVASYLYHLIGPGSFLLLGASGAIILSLFSMAL